MAHAVLRVRHIACNSMDCCDALSSRTRTDISRVGSLWLMQLLRWLAVFPEKGWNPSSLFYHASGPIRFVLRLSQTLRCPCLVLCVSMGRNGSIHTFGVLSSNLQTVLANATGRSRLYHGSFLAPDVSHSIMVFHTRLMFLSCLSTPSLLFFPPICQLFDCVAEKCSNYGSFMLLRQCSWSGIYKTRQTTSIHDWRLLKVHCVFSFVT
jgi:hypothetical protein